MNRILQLKPHPFRLLFYLEWILLGVTVLNELPWEEVPYLRELLGESAEPSRLSPFSWLLTVLCLIGFGLMGIRLPTGKPFGKWLYTALQLGLLWLPTATGSLNLPFLAPYLVIVIRGCLIFGLKGRLLVSGLVFISFLVSIAILYQDVQVIQSELTQTRAITLGQARILTIVLSVYGTFLFGLLLAFVLMLVNALLAERQSRQKLALAHEQLRQYALRIEDQAMLQERNRIAREIHDSLGHALTAQSIQLENALLFCHSNPDKTQAFLTEASKLAAMALKDIRHSVSALRSQPLHGCVIQEAIAALVENFYQTTNILPNSTICLNYPLSDEIGTAIYRIMQEALTNIFRHSRATQVILQLQTTPQWLHLLINDNGKGFYPEQNTTGFGLQGMRERTLALGGQFKIKSAPGSGCQIAVDIPLTNLITNTRND